MLLIFVEGNIGTGKSTFLKMIEEHHSGCAQVIYEPVDVWTSFKDNEGKNLLDYFYSDPKRYAYMFQNLAFISRIETLKAIDNKKKFVFIERSIWSDKNVFAQNCYSNGVMTDLEFKLYNKWFEWMQEAIAKQVEKCLFLYLKCPSTVSFSRLQSRNRPEEKSITLDYLNQLEARHEKWFSEISFMKKIIMDATVDFKKKEVFESMFKVFV